MDPALRSRAWLDSKVVGQYRAIHSRTDFRGADGSLYRVRDINVLGPYRPTKAAAIEDRDALKFGYESGGVEGLHLACCEASATMEKHKLPQKLIGWEVEVEITSDGLRKARGVCFCERQGADGAAEKVRVDGPWRKSRRQADQDAGGLRLAFSQEGLPGLQHVAAVQQMTASPVLPFSRCSSAISAEPEAA